MKAAATLGLVSVVLLIVIFSLGSGIYPPLAFAMRCGLTDSAELLIRMRITINKEDSYGRTPLEYAAMRHDMPKLIMLLESGAEVEGQESPGARALWWACMWGYRDMAALLIDSGVNVNVVYTPGNGWTPLNTAANWGHLNVVKMLIEKGADPSILDAREKTALMVAEESKHEKIVSFLRGQPAK